jgi:hypothetical protein
MRLLLAFLLLVPAWAQQPAAAPDQQIKPDAQAAPAPAPAAAAPTQATPAPAQTEAAQSPAPSTEPWITGSMYLGYRTITDIRGSMDEYRSVVDLGEGPKLLDLNFTIQDPKKRLFDRIDAWASGWGDDPYTTAHVNARKQGIYDFSIDYRNMAYFDAVPSFANPGAPAGFDAQSFDIHRRSMSVELNLFSGKHISPYLAFDRNSGYGNGIETWTNDANNTYPVPSMLRDSTNNYRGGVRFEYSRFHATLEQGGTTYKDDDQAHTASLQSGDITTPVFGQTLDLTSLNQAYGIRGTSIYSRALVTANPTPWLDIYGQFLYSEPKTNVNYTEIAGGNFLDLASLVFYSGQVVMGTGAANQPHTTSNLGFELRPFHRLRIVESWMTDRYHDAASPMVAEQMLLTPGAAGLSSLAALNYTQFVNYNQQQVEAIFDVTNRITLRAGYRYVWGDAQVLASELSQTGNLDSGQLRRNVALAGASYRMSEKLSFNLDYEGASSDDVYFRTSLNDYQKGRARARYQAVKSLAFQANFQVLNNQNPASNIRYDFESRANALTVFWTPNNSKWVSVMAEYDRTTLHSDIAYLTLPFLSASTSSYRDNAHTATSAVDLALPGLKGAKLTVGGSLFISAGFLSAESQPTHYYQPLARLSLPIVKNIYWNTEWQYYGFGEAFYTYEGFRTHIFTTGIRIAR